MEPLGTFPQCPKSYWGWGPVHSVPSARNAPAQSLAELAELFGSAGRGGGLYTFEVARATPT